MQPFTIFDFTQAYCKLYSLTENSLTPLDVEFIEDTFFEYASNNELPDFMLQAWLC